MINFMRFVLALAICWLASQPIAVGAPQKNDQEKDPRGDVLAYLAVAYQLDGRCHALKPDERKGLALQIEALRTALKVQKDVLDGPPLEISCDGELAKRLFDMARVKPKDQPVEKEEPDGEGWKFVQESWAKIFKELPPGKLGAFEGCWNGSIEGMPMGICILQKGDLVRFSLGSTGAPQCKFLDGGARQRQASVMFFTPAATPTCADSTPVQHAEGACKAISATEMECVVSIFSKDNAIYKTRNGKAISGQVTLKRKP